jgi:transcriptional regulator with XRE-family HTH domain
MKTFRESLQQLINFHSLENGSNTPDGILAGYLHRCLLNFDETLQQREAWYGRAMTIINAKKFKEARKYLRLKQTQMGERLGGYTLRAVQYWENGEREIPLGVQLIITQLMMQEEMLDALVKMTTTFGVDPEDEHQSEAHENAIQTIEKYSGMTYLEYLQTLD